MPETTRKRGRPATGKPQKKTWGVTATPADIAKLRGYPNQNRIVELLASGLDLGGSEAPDLTDAETDCLRSVLAGSVVDALFVRRLAGEVEGSEHPAAAGLLAKLRRPQVDYLVLQHLVLKYS